MAKKKDICRRIINYKNSSSPMYFEEIVDRLSQEDGIDPITICSYARACKQKYIKNNAEKLLFTLIDKKFGIIENFLIIRDEFPELTPLKLVEKFIESISDKINMRTVIDSAIRSHNDEVAFYGNVAFSQLQKRGVFSKKKKKFISFTVQALNKLIQNGIQSTSTNKISKLNVFKSFSGISRYKMGNHISRVFIILENLNLIQVEIFKDGNKKYYLPSKHIDIEDIFNSFNNGRFYKDLLKGIYGRRREYDIF